MFGGCGSWDICDGSREGAAEGAVTPPCNLGTERTSPVDTSPGQSWLPFPQRAFLSLTAPGTSALAELMESLLPGYLPTQQPQHLCLTLLLPKCVPTMWSLPSPLCTGTTDLGTQRDEQRVPRLGRSQPPPPLSRGLSLGWFCRVPAG